MGTMPAMVVLAPGVARLSIVSALLRTAIETQLAFKWLKAQW